MEMEHSLCILTVSTLTMKKGESESAAGISGTLWKWKVVKRGGFLLTVSTLTMKNGESESAAGTRELSEFQVQNKSGSNFRCNLGCRKFETLWN